MSKLHKQRSDQEWLELITECRRSGLADNTWCEQQGISTSSFYNAIRRLRRRACEIPGHSGVSPVIDLTSGKQDVVQINLVPDNAANSAGLPCTTPASLHLDNLHTIEILFKNGSALRVSNDADALLLRQAILAVGGSPC